MKLSETKIVYAATVVRCDHGDGPELRVLTAPSKGIAFDQQTAAEFLPILQHFIETGELPE
ncbi:hypothetical protein LJ084_003990 [Salmonella enterica]|nr:hypothetical protein [Salmonella enterica]ELT9219096.1 hypothetical protein [Salmonella enterica]